MAKLKEILDPTNPIAAAVLPLKAAAQDRAEKLAREVIAKVTAELAANNGNTSAFAAYPKAFNTSRAEYQVKLAKYQLVARLTKRASDDYRDDTRVMYSDACEHFVKEARDNAANQYDAFVCKLTAKIGVVSAAMLDGNHVWGESFLTVIKGAGVKEVWKTQAIINHTKYGMPYAQWPSRKVKHKF